MVCKQATNVGVHGLSQSFDIMSALPDLARADPPHPQQMMIEDAPRLIPIGDRATCAAADSELPEPSSKAPRVLGPSPAPNAPIPSSGSESDGARTDAASQMSVSISKDEADEPSPSVLHMDPSRLQIVLAIAPEAVSKYHRSPEFANTSNVANRVVSSRYKDDATTGRLISGSYARH